ncbi:MAG: ATP-dependent zinc metalloprotease FtsH [Ruminococcus sp.]|nr:ATP-dependent zinc metalloprotease FtsH [Ruminococcus sp.]MCM1392760.1 ATP-dependent zinc metalloprotease FtsH [Ruminococcus sp.]
MLLYLILPLVLILFIAYFTSSQNVAKTKYYEIVNMFKNNQVTEYTLTLSSGSLSYKVKGDNTEKKYTVANVQIFLNDIHDYVVKYNEENPNNAIKYDYKAGANSSVWASVLPMLLLSVLLGVSMFIMLRRINQSMMSETNRTISFSKAKVKLGKDDKRKTTFDDVAGADEEKEELSEIVDFLKDRSKFNEVGARIPKGILLVGPPGTGKTLLARAVAGEANVPFFSISGSDFVEMYVGVGASRVRDLFAQAKKNSPSILFIDEIDAVGRHRGAGMGGGHDEREQTLNQLLVEMDGFGANEGVIIIAATNRPDILDPALLRPGRFDRQITVGYPDIKGREEILKVHSKGKSIAPDVELRVIARSTAGFTGADLENLLNEAALLAVRKKKKAITMTEIEEATIKVMMGTEKKSHKMSDKEKKLTAYHEAGHAIATNYLEGQDPVHQVSIIPRGMAGGFTMSLPSEDRSYKLKNDMLDDIVVLLGGRVAEALVLDDISTGASNDIERATDIARDMVTRYGMSKTIGPVSFTSGSHEVFLGRDYGNTRNYSENLACEIDKEINGIVTNAYSRCEQLLNEHMDKLHILAQYLIKHEKIDADDFKKLMNGDLDVSFETADTKAVNEDGSEDNTNE